MPEPDFLSEFGFVPVHSFLVPLDTWDFHLSESQFSLSQIGIIEVSIIG